MRLLATACFTCAAAVAVGTAALRVDSLRLRQRIERVHMQITAVRTELPHARHALRVAAARERLAEAMGQRWYRALQVVDASALGSAPGESAWGWE